MTAIATQAGKSARASTASEGAPALADADVVARAREGDHDAFRVLVERYQGRVQRLALRILRDEELARDAVQEIFLKTYRSLRRFEGRSGFYTWLYRLAFNHCLDVKRRDRWGQRVSFAEEPALEAAAHDADAGLAVLHSEVAGPAAELERSELRQVLAGAIATLPEDARNTLVLREVDGLSYAEIAEALDIPKGTVMSRLYYARKRLKQVLGEAGVSLQSAASSEEAAS